VIGLLLPFAAAGLAVPVVAQKPEAPMAYRVPAKLADVVEPLEPGAVKLSGVLGQRVALNEQNRLLKVDEDAILAGFRKRPGEQAWIGEHVGKWLHAATLAWVNTGDPALRAKLDRVVTELLKTQEADGYLGTYTPDKRFGLYPNADWDVWVHKYNLLGLLTYHRYTGDERALRASVRMGDLLLATFGPGKKSILSAGTHVGMAATSVLEPMVLLYRTTGDRRYLEFAEYLVKSWDEPGGPRVLSTILAEKSVAKTANGKAYEMLSNLVGLCELARVTGEKRYVMAADTAWRDVVDNQLYLTGSASHHEHFHEGHDLPNRQSANVGETCVTVTWIQLNAQLLRLTGEARFGDELERSYYNHLMAAQRPDGAQWCYYTSLEGTKPYGPGINCCVSSGPRGMALAPGLVFLRTSTGSGEGIAVNLIEPALATVSVGGAKVTIEQKTAFPGAPDPTGRSYIWDRQVFIKTDNPVAFPLQLRVPEWANRPTIWLNGKPIGTARTGGWIVVPARKWSDGDSVTYQDTVETRLVLGKHRNAGLAALTFGPMVLAYDQAQNAGLPPPRALGLTERSAAKVHLIGKTEVVAADGKATQAVFVPFADAGSSGGRYAVWLRAPGAPLPMTTSPFAFAEESRSREGNVGGEIADGDTSTFVVTFDAKPRDEDWFAVRVDKPVGVRRLVFAHGKSFHDGGWFDASAGKPRFEMQSKANGPWEPLGVLESYPATTATDSKGLKEGQAFTLRLKDEVQVTAIRIIGKPASGDNPKQAFASCAELQAFAD